MNSNNSTKKKMPLLVRVIIRLISGVVVIAMVLLIPAGTIHFYEAWILIGVMFIPMIIAMLVLYRKDPELLEKRMNSKEKQKSQKIFLILSLFIFPAVLILPAFDYRFSWSEVPLYVIISADCLVFAGYLLFLLVLRENSFASRVVEIQKGQKVIDTGPYSIVRHPMYSAMLIMFCSIPLALNSLWSMPVVIFIPVLLAFRLFNEEKVLKQELDGYNEYCKKVRYRLIPFIF